MMSPASITVRLGNYRCFSREAPVELTIGDGITAIVGRNNSGKSSLLRFFHDFRGLFPLLARMPDPGTSWKQLSFLPPIRDPRDLLCNKNDGDITIEIDMPADSSHGIPGDHQTVAGRIRRSDALFNMTKTNGHDFNAFNAHTASGGVMRNAGGQILLNTAGLETGLHKLTTACYIPSHRNANNIGGSQSYDIFVGSAFVQRWVEARDGDNQPQRRRMNQVEEDVRRLMGFKQFQARKAATTQTLLVQIDADDYHLEDVGAGVAQLLILLGTVALRDPPFLLIDEPELHLHPSLQMDLLSVLAGYVRGNLVFATHNIGLARALATRIYAVRQHDSGTSTVHPLEDTPTLAQFLGELQYGAHAQVGGNRVLMVEGADDVLVFQQFLRKFEHDHQVVILPLGGNTLINKHTGVHLQEVKRICPNVAVVIDSERKAAGAPLGADREQFLANCKATGFAAHATERRATEHYFPARALNAAFGEKANELEPYADLNLTGGWSKGTNWLAAREMTRDEVAATDIGQFLMRWLGLGE